MPLIGFTNCFPYSIVTKYYHRSLFSALRSKSHPLDSTHKTVIALGIAYGMNFLHSQNIIHRDLKSPNILLNTYDVPAICDFGLAKSLNNKQETLTTEIGTCDWTAPEVFQSPHYTFKVDVYSFGVMLWEMITARQPYKGLTAMQVAFAVTQNKERPKFPKDTPVKLKKFIQKCWHQNPDKRPTFAKIVVKIAKHKVSFPGTDKYFVDEFRKWAYQRIKHSKEELIQKAPNLPKKEPIQNSKSEMQLPIQNSQSAKQLPIPTSQSERKLPIQNLHRSDEDFLTQEPEYQEPKIPKKKKRVQSMYLMPQPNQEQLYQTPMVFVQPKPVPEPIYQTQMVYVPQNPVYQTQMIPVQQPPQQIQIIQQPRKQPFVFKSDDSNYSDPKFINSDSSPHSSQEKVSQDSIPKSSSIQSNIEFSKIATKKVIKEKIRQSKSPCTLR